MTLVGLVVDFTGFLVSGTQARALLVFLDLTCCPRSKLIHQILLSTFLQEFGLIFQLSRISLDTVNNESLNVAVPLELQTVQAKPLEKGRDISTPPSACARQSSHQLLMWLLGLCITMRSRSALNCAGAMALV